MFYKKCDVCGTKLNKAKSVFLKQGMVCECGTSYIAKKPKCFLFFMPLWAIFSEILTIVIIVVSMYLSYIVIPAFFDKKDLSGIFVVILYFIACVLLSCVISIIFKLIFAVFFANFVIKTDENPQKSLMSRILNLFKR